MSGGREVTSEQSSLICEGVSYDQVYPLGCKLEEDITWSPARESSAYSFVEGEKGYKEDEEGDVEGEKGDDEEGGGDDDKGDESDGGSEKYNGGSVSRVDSSGNRPFILPSIWMVNDFYPTMTRKVFNTLCGCHQILDNIPLHLPGKFEKCYSGKTADMGMYDAMFTIGLRLPLTELHRQLANYLSLFVSQIVSNAWRIFIGVVVIWGQLSGGNRRLTLDKFFYCYKP